MGHVRKIPQRAMQSARIRATQVSQSESRRILFIDALRLIAAVQMIQGHTLDALLSSMLRQGVAFEVWTFTRGLTSTAFLVSAGLACVLAQDASRSGSRADPCASRGDLAAGRRRRLRRALRLLLIGYAMHAPLGVLLGEEPLAAVRKALVVDVLQCIAVSVALLELLHVLVVRRGVRALLACGLGALCFALAGLPDRLHPAVSSGPWLPLTNYFSARDGSLFPLIPWSGFVFWGMGVGLTLLPEQGPLVPRRAASRLAAWGLGFLLAALLTGTLRVGAGAQLSAAACALRLGLVLLLAALLVASLEGRVRLPRLLARLSSETLFLYVSHVLVLYASYFGLASVIGRNLGLGAALLWAALLLAGASAGALGYRRAQQSLRQRWGRGTSSRPNPAAQTPPTPG
jgi:uncharacterized membrane protein